MLLACANEDVSITLQSIREDIFIILNSLKSLPSAPYGSVVADIERFLDNVIKEN